MSMLLRMDVPELETLLWREHGISMEWGSERTAADISIAMRAHDRVQKEEEVHQQECELQLGVHSKTLDEGKATVGNGASASISEEEDVLSETSNLPSFADNIFMPGCEKKLTRQEAHQTRSSPDKKLTRQEAHQTRSSPDKNLTR